MASQTWTLTTPNSLGSNVVEWSAANISDEAVVRALRPSDDPAFLTYLYITVGGGRFIRMRTAPTAADSLAGARAGPDLSDAFETDGIITLTVGGHVLELSIPDDMEATDRAEPYTWQFTTSTLTRVTAWYNQLDDTDTGTIELSDGVAAAAVAPDVAINAIADGNMGDSVDLSLQLVGGNYDSLTYQWSESTSQGGHAIERDNIGTTAGITWTRPVVNQDGDATVTVVVTAHGNGGNAIDGTSDTSEDLEITRVFHIPSADAPSIDVRGIANGNERTEVTLVADLGNSHIGLYDELDYNWQCFGNAADGTFTNFATSYPGSIDDATAKSPTWTRPSVPSNRDFFLRGTITARGTNVRAFTGTHESTHAQVRTTVYDITDASCPTLYHVQTTNDNPDGTGHVTWHNGLVNGLEDTPVWVRLDHGNDGHYDNADVSFEHKLVSGSEWTEFGDYTWDGSGDFSPPIKKWTRPLVSDNQQWQMRITVHVEGEDNRAETNTDDTRAVTTGAGTVLDHPNPDAPGIQVQSYEGDSWRDGFASHRERSSLRLRVFMRDGVYDNLAYTWTLRDNSNNDVTVDTEFTDGDGRVVPVTFTDPTSKETHVRLPSVTTTTRYWVQVQVTASGTDTIADSSTTDTATNRAFIDVTPHPDADAPSFDDVRTITAKSNNTVRVTPLIGNHRGTYDSLTWKWELRTYADRASTDENDLIQGVFDDDTAHYPMMTVPDVGDNRARYVLKGTLTAHGSDIIAEQGTSESSSHEESFWVDPLPLPSTPGSAGFAQPSGTISIHPEVAHEGEHVQLVFHPNGGGYDSLRMFWIFEPPTGSNTELTHLNDKTEGVFTVPALDSSGTARIRVNVWGRGDGKNYRTGELGNINPRGSNTFRVIAGVRAQDLNVTWTDDAGETNTINGASIVDDNGFYWPINGLHYALIDGSPEEIWTDGS